jgi:hypothetical protein
VPLGQHRARVEVCGGGSAWESNPKVAILTNPAATHANRRFARSARRFQCAAVLTEVVAVRRDSSLSGERYGREFHGSLSVRPTRYDRSWTGQSTPTTRTHVVRRNEKDRGTGPAGAAPGQHPARVQVLGGGSARDRKSQFTEPATTRWRTRISPFHTSSGSLPMNSPPRWRARSRKPPRSLATGLATAFEPVSSRVTLTLGVHSVERDGADEN